MKLQRLNPPNVTLPAVATVSKAVHDGRNLILNQLAGHTITLPKAVGSSAVFRFITTVAPTSNANIIKVIDGVDVMVGGLNISTAAGTATTFPTVATSDTVTLNRTTSGGASNGEVLVFEDIAPGIWFVSGMLNGSGAGTTPFSATVT
jgi:hypothetical protein